MMELCWDKSINGKQYRCPICNTWYPREDILSAGGACPNCGFHENGGLKPKSKSQEYDCKKCLHEDVCNLWHEKERQDASSFQFDGCDYYKDKSHYICVDDINGPGPDPRGEEGTPGCMGKSDWDITKCLREVIKQIELERIIRDNPKEATQCGDANGRGND